MSKYVDIFTELIMVVVVVEGVLEHQWMCPECSYQCRIKAWDLWVVAQM